MQSINYNIIMYQLERLKSKTQVQTRISFSQCIHTHFIIWWFRSYHLVWAVWNVSLTASSWLLPIIRCAFAVYVIISPHASRH